MTCDDATADLVAFHFGELTGPARHALEHHLGGCPACVKAYLSLKRDIEGGPDDLAEPSPALKARLRTEIEAHFLPLPWKWWERPAAFASAALAVVLAAWGTLVIVSGVGDHPAEVAVRPARMSEFSHLAWRTASDIVVTHAVDD